MTSLIFIQSTEEEQIKFSFPNTFGVNQIHFCSFIAFRNVRKKWSLIVFRWTSFVFGSEKEFSCNIKKKLHRKYENKQTCYKTNKYIVPRHNHNIIILLFFPSVSSKSRIKIRKPSVQNSMNKKYSQNCLLWCSLNGSSTVFRIFLRKKKFKIDARSIWRLFCALSKNKNKNQKNKTRQYF